MNVIYVGCRDIFSRVSSITKSIYDGHIRCLLILACLFSVLASASRADWDDSDPEAPIPPPISLPRPKLSDQDVVNAVRLDLPSYINPESINVQHCSREEGGLFTCLIALTIQGKEIDVDVPISWERKRWVVH